MNEKLCIFIRNTLTFVPIGLTDNKAALFQVMAWQRQASVKPLPEPMMTQFIDAYTQH